VKIYIHKNVKHNPFTDFTIHTITVFLRVDIAWIILKQIFSRVSKIVYLLLSARIIATIIIMITIAIITMSIGIAVPFGVDRV